MAIVLYIACSTAWMPLPRLLTRKTGLAALMSLAGGGGVSSVAKLATVLIPLCLALNLPDAILPLLLSVELLDFSRNSVPPPPTWLLTAWARRWPAASADEEDP